ncbi:putative coiled-coil domain-containing protein 195 [Melozone crissalis]|uniref:putative coiled-coil domain-containing protein 195 n=1 Tax=Melozone crissalis TaxID=40204 RepID=UPI0023D9ADC4|nr:putative coiled-coil domain-containing protein 195 [Melozone crissalis]
MEGNPHLLQLVRKMRSQIRQLERENRALKGELRGCGHTAPPAPGQGSGPGAEGPAASPASPASPSPLQGGAAAAAAPREHTDAAMTVRRYPSASPAPSSTRGKVKAVSFLLPTDMSSFAEKQGSPKSLQNQSTKHLMTVTEKDM